MNTTHPHIIKMELFGYIDEPEPETYLGECAECGEPVTDEWAHVEQEDGLFFCGMECAKRFYGLEEKN